MFNFGFLDEFLDTITSYRLVEYVLLFLAGFAVLLGFLGLLSYSGLQLLFTAVVLLVTCYYTNLFLSRFFKAPTNVESALITALLIFCILTPITNVSDTPAIILAGIIGMASKYILALRKKHIFNPAAVAVFVVGLFVPVASWWIASAALQPIIAIVGFLVIRKIRRFHLVFSFLLVTLLTILGQSILSGTGGLSLLPQLFTSWPIVFFAAFMLTEPLTTPPTKKLQVMYGALVGIIFGSQLHIGIISSTPEFSLILGNIFSYLVSSKEKLFLQLHHSERVSPEIVDYVYTAPKVLSYQPGQYMEWTLAHVRPDKRGNRRYFTLASSPTEDYIRIGIRQTQRSSSFKKALAQSNNTHTIIASQVAGDFILPKDAEQKLVFIAGGIGITPFRSMIKYLIDTNQKRQITLLYTAKVPQDFAYKTIFDEAKEKLGIKVIYTITNKESSFPEWTGERGRITPEFISRQVSDLKESVFYLSGPITMVKTFEEQLKALGVKGKQIKTDFFPGFA